MSPIWVGSRGLQQARWSSVAAVTLLAVCACATQQTSTTDVRLSGTPASVCLGSLNLPPGFCATVFADSVGSARHIAVADNGDVYVNLQRARPNSGGAGKRSQGLALRDTDGDGVADMRLTFGDTGNTGIAVHSGHVYLDVGGAIVRFQRRGGELLPSGPAETVVSGLPTTPGHGARNFAISRDGSLFVNMGSATNACQERDRQAGSRGVDPCVELRTRAGIWRFNANRTGQVFGPEQRFATGIRNAVGVAISPADGALYAATHGRDQLHENWPAMFTAEQNAELPSEELLRVEQGGDYGWPYCYWDGARNARVLAPEYGGDGSRAGRCATVTRPVVALPAHWAPNALLFYSGSTFPAKYRGGAFIAFHGSWNRAPLPQGGYNVVFIPFINGRATGEFEVFASGFVPQNVQPNTAAHRPSGLAMGPDGELYVTDDVGGRIWRITYRP